MPRRLGQHFLADRGLLAKIADALQLDRSRLVLEIGAGRGTLTELLAERAGLVAAIELDPPLASLLRKKFADNPGVRVVEADVLEVSFARLIAATGGPWSSASVAGNLPYYITSPILLHLFESAALFERIVVLVQLEVAQRLAAKPGSRNYGLLSVTAQYYTQPELLFRIPAGAFQPPPKVDSALVRMRVAQRGGELGISDEKRFMQFLRACFRQKRKMLRNNLKDDPAVTDVLRKLDIDPNIRAEALGLAQLAAIFASAKSA